MPTEMRIIDEVMPISRCRAGSTSAWVIVAGCSARRLGAAEAHGEVHQLQAVQHAKASASPPWMSNAKVEPGARHCRW